MVTWLRRLRARILDRRAEAELAAELRFHIERQAVALEAQGLGAEEAHRAALRCFGNPVLTAERCRDQRRLGWAEDAAGDLRQAARNLRHAPGFALAATVLLALGFGAVTALFGPLYSLVLAPLPFPQASRLVQVTGLPMPYGFYQPNLRRALDPVFSHIAEFGWISGSAPVPARPSLDITTVTQEFFPAIGVGPRLGRDFRLTDHELDGVIVSNALWRTRLHANPDIAGVAFRIHGEPFPVLGVMPPGFDFPGHTQVWMLPPKGSGLEDGSPLFARLQPGLSLAAATARLKVIARTQHLDAGRVFLRPLHDYLLGDRRPLLWILWAVALLFLLLACAGIANLILARGIRRQPEVTLRLALGASRARIIRQLLAEALLLAGAGAALGLGLAALAGGALRAALPAAMGRTPFAPQPALTASVGVVIALAIGATLVCGMLPAWRAARSDAGVYLKASGSGTGIAPGGRWHFGSRDLLTGSQLALALALLIATGLLVRSVAARLDLNFGFDARHVVAIQAQLPPPPALVKAWRAFDRLQRANHNISANRTLQTKELKKSGLGSASAAEEQRDDRVFAAAQADLSRVPGVLAAGELAPLPFNGIQSRPFEVVRLQPGEWAPYILAYTRSAGGDFIRALGIRLLAGRTFTPAETAAAAGVEETAARTWGSWRQNYILPVVVNQALTQRYWPGQSALGKMFYRFGRSQVIGVVSNIHESSANLAVWPTVYVPVQLLPNNGNLAVIVRLRPGTPVAPFRAVVTRILASLAPGIRPPHFISLAAQAKKSWASLRLALFLLACFAVLGVAVAGLGVYAGAAEMAAARRREMGIRIALGARPEQIQGMALWRSVRLAVGALPLGAFGAWALARGLSHWLFQVGAADPASYAAAAALLVLLALLAGFLPAHRAAHSDPAAALRDDG